MEEEAAEERRQRLQEMKNYASSFAKSLAEEMHKAITEGMEFDFDKLFQDFVKSKVAEQMSAMLTDSLARPLSDYRLAYKLMFHDFKRITVQEIKDLMGLAPALGLSREIMQKLTNIVIEGNAALLTEFFKEEELERWGKLLAGVAERGVKTRVSEAYPMFERGISAVDEALGIYSDTMQDTAQSVLDYIPSATFRAVTEPQAQQLLAYAGEQIDVLRRIELNTRQGLEQPQEILYNLNQSLDVQINGESLISQEQIDLNALADMIVSRIDTEQGRANINRQRAIGARRRVKRQRR